MGPRLGVGSRGQRGGGEVPGEVPGVPEPGEAASRWAACEFFVAYRPGSVAMSGCQRVSAGESRNETLRASREPWWGGEAGGPAPSVRGDTGSWGPWALGWAGETTGRKDPVTWHAVFTKANTTDPPSPGPSVPSSLNPAPPPRTGSPADPRGMIGDLAQPRKGRAPGHTPGSLHCDNEGCG